ncbi:TonB-dependent receptor, partial [uncultured Sphingomonas sp.]|uniref:TonB-dependent receptor n=1 Tax=uncultured Sphingomonas sp. TaxID=158754 RepID=UPI0025F9CAA2
KIDQFIPGVSLATGDIFDDPTLSRLGTALLKSRYREIAGFANGTLHLTERFDITAGARLSEIKQRTSQESGGVLAGGESPPEFGRSKENVFTYSLSPRFDINDQTAVYARVAKGYRPGGPNILPATAPADVPRSYDADTIISYEAGIKSDIGRRLSFDLSVYHLKWKDIQLFTVIDNFGLNANGGSAVSNGIEGTLTLRPMTGMRLSLNGALIDAHLTEDTPPLVGGFDNDDLPYTPKVSFGVNGDYEWQLAGTTTYVGASVRFVGRQRDNFVAGEIVGVDPDTGEFQFEFSPQRRIPRYATLDLRAGAELGRFTVDAFVRNVTNSKGVNSLSTFTDELTGGNPLPNDAIRAALTQPRTIGFTVGTEF